MHFSTNCMHAPYTVSRASELERSSSHQGNGQAILVKILGLKSIYSQKSASCNQLFCYGSTLHKNVRIISNKYFAYSPSFKKRICISAFHIVKVFSQNIPEVHGKIATVCGVLSQLSRLHNQLKFTLKVLENCISKPNSFTLKIITKLSQCYVNLSNKI